jgi:parvulin-like peptidyl-prolyl isomerase
VTKKKIEKMQKEYTKPQLSRWEQQKRRQRIILFSGIGLIAVVVLGLVAAWFFEQMWPLYKTVIDVNGQKITMNDYVKTLKATTKGAAEADLLNTAYYTESALIQAALITQEAAAQNISVTDEEVNKYINDNKLDAGWAPLVRSSLLAQKLRDEYFKSQVPTTAEQRDIEVMFLESDSQASQIRAELEGGASFSDLAAANSLDNYSKTNKGAMGMHPQEIFISLLGSSVPGDYAFSSETGSLSQPRPDSDKEKAVGYWLISVIEKGTGDLAGQINVRVMLLSSEEEANQVRTAIVDNGQDFATIANEKSQYDTGGKNGGLVGFISQDKFSAVFDEVAFNMEVGEISQPVKDISQTTKGGSWLVKVIDSATDKEVNADDITTLTNGLYSNWYLQVESTAVIDNKITNVDIEFALGKVTGS